MILRLFQSREGACFKVPKQMVSNFSFRQKERIAYPKHLINFQKPGTGVWSVDLLRGTDAESIDLGYYRD